MAAQAEAKAPRTLRKAVGAHSDGDAPLCKAARRCTGVAANASASRTRQARWKAQDARLQVAKREERTRVLAVVPRRQASRARPYAMACVLSTCEHRFLRAISPRDVSS